MGRRISDYFYFYVNNPFKTYWKARKYFKFPKIKFSFHCGKYYRSRVKILEFTMFDVRWKDKYDTPRFEGEPKLYLCLFGIFTLFVSLHIYYIDELGYKRNVDDYYWEYLLDYLYYEKKLSNVSNWRGESLIYQEYDHINHKTKYSNNSVPITNFSLTKKGFKQLRKELGK